MLNFFKQFFLIGFLAAGLAGCVTTPQFEQDLSPLQDAYIVRDSLILAKTALEDALDMGKISRASYNATWKIADDADKIVKGQIDNSRRGMVSTTALETAKAKINQVAAVNGGVK